MRFCLFLSIMSLLIISCAPVIRVNSFDNETRQPNEGEIGVFSNAQSVPYNYKEIHIKTHP